MRRAGKLSYYVAGSGTPILLIHSVNAAASAYEVRPIYESVIRSHRAYGVDLPGFGFSDRSSRRYDVRLYVEAIHDMLDEIAAEHGRMAVDATALSTSCEFLAIAATERPDSFRSLTFVTPTGFNRGSDLRRGPEGSTLELPAMYRVLNVPVWSRGLYNLLVTRPVIRLFLERTWGSKHIDEDLLAYDYLTTHQPGAKNAVYNFVAGRLFSGQIRTVFEQLTLPILLLHGTKGDFADFSEAGWTSSRRNWRVLPFATGAFPHFERLSDFMTAYRGFLEEPPG